jgi:UDP-N-acetyl-D-galactosamine dehydrogenase
VDVIDPYASSKEFEHEYGISLTEAPNGKYDAIILAVSHEEYKNQPESYFQNLGNENTLLVDIKGLYKNKIQELAYWSL